MIEAAVKAYLQVKARQPDLSRALYLIAMEFDERGLVEAAVQRAEQATVAMPATTTDGRFADPHAVIRLLFAAIHGMLWMFYEREIASMIGEDGERQLTMMCRSYVAASKAA
jgi:hypothetical protein